MSLFLPLSLTFLRSINLLLNSSFQRVRWILVVPSLRPKGPHNFHYSVGLQGSRVRRGPSTTGSIVLFLPHTSFFFSLVLFHRGPHFSLGSSSRSTNFFLEVQTRKYEGIINLETITFIQLYYKSVDFLTYFTFYIDRSLSLFPVCPSRGT